MNAYLSLGCVQLGSVVFAVDEMSAPAAQHPEGSVSAKWQAFCFVVRLSDMESGCARAIDLPIIKGSQIYHNYIRPHEALDGETPADRCGIKVEGDNEWLTIIQNASKKDADMENLNRTD